MAPKIRNWFSDPTSGATVVIAFATGVNLLVSAGLWLATKESVNVARSIFETAHRPYIGTESVTGKVVHSEENPKIRNLFIQASFKNFGTAPAQEADFGAVLLVNGIAQETIASPSLPTIFFPSSIRAIDAFIGWRDIDQVLNGQIKVHVVTSAVYRGPNGKDTYCEKFEYDHRRNAFASLGICDEHEPYRKRSSE